MCISLEILDTSASNSPTQPSKVQILRHSGTDGRQVSVACPGGGDVQASNQSGHHYIVVDCLNLPEKQNKTKKLNNSRLAEFFASLRSFPILSFQSSIPVTVFFSVSTSLFCESNKYVDYWHDKPNKPKNKKRNKEKTPPNV